MTVVVEAPAKINLMLDILGKRDDGYHNLWMVMQSVSVCDRVTVSLTSEAGIRLTCTEPGVPTDEHNIAWKAALAFLEAAALPTLTKGISIQIEKNIPAAAGLAGGSADGAAVLLALDKLFGTDFTARELCDIGLKIGADVPFCLLGGTMLAEETGGKLTALQAMPGCYIVLGKPDYGVSTARAYSEYDSYMSECRHPDKTGMLQALENQELEEIGRLTGNVFEQFIDVPDRVSIKSVMRRHNALGVCMSGSGPTVFGLFEREADAENCADELEDLIDEIHVCVPVSRGCKIINRLE